MTTSSTQSIPKLNQTAIDRFWNKVAITADFEKCWVWQGSFRRRGYGRFAVTVETNKDKSFAAHRIAYYLHYKIDPIGSIILHKCDNPSCVNPRHLRIGTNEENTEDMMSKGRGKEQFGDGSD